MMKQVVQELRREQELEANLKGKLRGNIGKSMV
jgi:hypothetical protein